MEKNTELLWALVAVSVECPITQQPADASNYSAVLHGARAMCARDGCGYLAQNLIAALAHPKKRGLIGALNDIRDEIGEEPPKRRDFNEALKIMARDAENPGDDFHEASKVVRHFLNRDIGRRP
jgi:hypothetical protein